MSLSNSSCASSVRLSAQSAVMGVIACGTRKSQSITVHMGWKVTRTAQKAMTDVRLPLGLEMRIKIRAMLNDCVLLMNENNTNLSRSFSCTVIWFAGPAVLPSVTWSHTDSHNTTVQNVSRATITKPAFDGGLRPHVATFLSQREHNLSSALWRDDLLGSTTVKNCIFTNSIPRKIQWKT